MRSYEEFVCFESWSYEYVRRRKVLPPGVEMTIDMNSELSIPDLHANVECFIDGSRTILPNGRLSFDMNLPDTPDVHIRLVVTEPTTLFEYAFVPVGKDVKSLAGYFRTNATRLKLFRRSKPSLHEYMSSCTEVRIGPRPFSSELLLRYPNITTLKIEVCRQNDFDWTKFQVLVRNMTWLEEVHVHFVFHCVEPYVFELFDGLPKRLSIQGRVTLVALERLENVRHLTLNMSGHYVNPIGSELIPHLQNLESLECIFGTLQLDVQSLASLKRLRLERVHGTYRDTVAIGRLLRRNQLDSLELTSCTWLKKQELRPIVQPLLDGTNTSLQRLGLIGIHLSRHMIYMLSEVIAFCPTLTALSADHCAELHDLAGHRNALFEDVRNIRIAKKHVSGECVLWRTLWLTESVLVNSVALVPTYRRQNRRWYRTGSRQIVCAPFEF